MDMIHLSDILQAHLKAYKKKHRLSCQQSKVLGSLSKCRTGALGYAEVTCECGQVSRMALSCRDRHCPRCQGRDTVEWMLRETGKLLPVPYYHLVFTVPEQLHPFFKYNEALLYGTLFDCAVGSVQTFARNDARLGCKLGITAILHTWGQRLQYHPHVHMIVAGGGIDDTGNWRQVDPSRGPWLFSVKALSLHFRGRLLGALERALRRNALRIPPGLQPLAVLGEASRRKWSVFSQCASAGADKVLRYLGRYTRKAAIGESRLLGLSDGQIRFRAKDYRLGTEGSIALNSEEFIRRFCTHILPRGFRRLRQYGWQVRGVEHARQACRVAALATRKQWVALITICQQEVQRHLQAQSHCPQCGCNCDNLPPPVLLLAGYPSIDTG